MKRGCKLQRWNSSEPYKDVLEQTELQIKLQMYLQMKKTDDTKNNLSEYIETTESCVQSKSFRQRSQHTAKCSLC
jgi:hypothetical protein